MVVWIKGIASKNALYCQSSVRAYSALLALSATLLMLVVMLTRQKCAVGVGVSLSPRSMSGRASGR